MGKKYLKKLISAALREDIGGGDITATLLFPEQIKVKAKIAAKEDGVACGVTVAEEVFKAVGKGIRVRNKIKDGAEVKKGQVICVIEGDAKTILTAERTALNFLGRLSGIATLTRKYVNAIRPYEVKIMDTRKTAPGLRQLEKYAVKCGRGVNHRMGLYDQVLVKDNHLKVLSIGYRVLSIKNTIRELRKKTNKKIEIEVQNLKEFREALNASPDVIMLDNMSMADIKKAVAVKNKLNTQYAILNTKLEVSGGVTLANVRAIASTGVEMISIGALTHSARSLDFSLEIM